MQECLIQIRGRETAGFSPAPKLCIQYFSIIKKSSQDFPPSSCHDKEKYREPAKHRKYEN
jgi:hypothetical protein